MSGWVVPNQTRSAGIQLPPGLRIATTGSRAGAWLIDRAFFCVLALLLGGIAVVAGAVDISPAAADQIQAGTSANLVTVPLLTVNTSLLVVFGAVWVLIQYVYEALSWTLFRGTPGQRILSMWVADAATGRNLTIWRSSLRWLVLESVPQIALTVFLVFFVRMMGEVPPSAYGAGGLTGSIPDNSTYTTVSLVGDLAALLSVGWRLGLLVITATHSEKRGIHDRIAGSVVVARAPAPSYWTQVAYGPVGPVGAGGPFPGPGTAPGYPAGRQFPPGQWQAPSGGQTPAPDPAQGTRLPSGGPSASPPGGGFEQPGELPVPGVQPESGGQPGATPVGWPSPDAWTPPTSRWSPWALGRNRPQFGGSRQTRDPNWTGQPSEESMPRAQRLSDGTELPAGLRVPPMPRRLGAYLIDCVIVYVSFSVWLGVFGYAGGEKQAILAGVIAGVGQLAYFVGCWHLYRGTIGQRVLHLQIGDFQTGKALSWGDAFTRWCILQGPFALVTVVPAVLSTFVLFGAAGWAAFLLYEANAKPDHRAVHDRAVRSLVAETA